MYPLCKTTRHLITSTKRPKMAYVESAFTYNLESSVGTNVINKFYSSPAKLK